MQNDIRLLVLLLGTHLIIIVQFYFWLGGKTFKTKLYISLNAKLRNKIVNI